MNRAIAKSIQQPTGIVCTHWQVVEGKIDLPAQKITVKLNGYISPEVIKNRTASPAGTIETELKFSNCPGLYEACFAPLAAALVSTGQALEGGSIVDVDVEEAN